MTCPGAPVSVSPIMQSPQRMAGIAGSLLLAVAPMVAGGQPAPSSDSPFAPAAVQGQAAAPTADYDLSGAITTSKGIQVCIFDRMAKRSRWIPVGTEQGGIQVLEFDPATDQAVVRVNGESRVLHMLKPVVVAAPFEPSPAVVQMGVGGAQDINVGKAPVPAAGYVKPLAEERAEREARMFVSDLLEIGQQQRKAYEEAQKKAAAARQQQGS